MNTNELSLSGLELDRRPLDLGRLRAGTMFGLLGSPDSTSAVVELLGARTEVAPPPVIPTGPRASRRRARAWVRDFLRHANAGSGEAALAEASSVFGLTDEILRARLGDLDPTALSRLRLAAGWATGAQWLTFIDPFAGVPGHARTGLRTRLAALAADHDRGIVFSTSSLPDLTVAEAGVANIEQGALVALGDFSTIVMEPRGSLPAELSGVNIYSGLARKGWLSIGHSAVRARTELDGKVYVTLGWRSAALSLDEHDPAFTEPSVFEAIVVGLRDRGTCIQAKLSPVDTEMGLPLDVDLADVSTDNGHGFGILHPGLGPTLAELRRNIVVGSHVFVEVDTSGLHAYSVE